MERDAPDIVTDHWMPYLEENDRLADCPPEEFNATEGWVPLYTPGEARRTFAGSFVSLRVGQASPPNGGCTPKLPPWHGQRVHADELSPKGVPEKDVPDDKWKRRQVAFCPYCGVTNDNAKTGLTRPDAFGRDACVWGLPHQECLPGAGTPEAYER